MTRKVIIEQLRKYKRSKEQVTIEENILGELIKAEQGSKSQKNCTHGCYGNGYGINEDICSDCFKILTKKDKDYWRFL